MLRKVGMALCFLSAFAFFNLCSSRELYMGPEDVPFLLGTYAEYTQNANMFMWTQFDSTATIWDLTTYPGEQTAKVYLLDPSQGIPPAPDTFPSAQLVELDSLADGSETWTYMSKDSFYLYAEGVDFEVATLRFLGNYQPDGLTYFFPMYYGNSWITAWTWQCDVGLPYWANEMHTKETVAKGWVKTEVTNGQYWPCLVIRDYKTFSDNFGTSETRWLYEWVVAGRFGGGNGIAAAVSTNGGTKDFVIVDMMLRLKYLDIPGWDLTCPTFDSTTIWTDTTFTGPYPVSSIITDDNGIGADSLFYRVDSDSFVGVGHDSVVGDKYFFAIPEVAASCTISYYLWAEDSFSVVNGIDIWTTDPEAAPENNLFTFVVTAVGVEEAVLARAEGKGISVYPNPFSSRVIITASSVSDGAESAVKIYDQSGRLVNRLELAHAHENRADRTVSISWAGVDEKGRPVPSGIYYAVLEKARGMGGSNTAKLIRMR